MEKYDRDIFKQAVKQMSNIVGRLDKLIGIADRPRKQEEKPVSQQRTPTEEDYAAGRKILPTPQIPTTSPKAKESNKCWYKTLAGWKIVIELIALPFAIGYAVVTYCEWKDLRHNFQADERAWVKVRTDKDIHGVYESDKPVPWREDTPDYPVWVVRLTNLGKSVATDLHTDGILEVLDKSQTPSMTFPFAHTQEELKVLFPEEDSPFSVTFNQISSPRPLIRDEYDKLMDGDDYLVVFTETTYRDQFGLHWSRMCNFAGAFDVSKTKSFVHAWASKPCADWNAVGDGLPPSDTQ
jgi:hypothetical protein